MLRPIQENDFDNLLPFSLNEPHIWKFGLLTAAGEENLKNYLSTAVKNLKDEKEYPFIVFDKKANSYAGSTRFYDIQQPWFTTQLGYTWYRKDFQRTVLNRHCKLLLATYVFEDWGNGTIGIPGRCKQCEKCYCYESHRLYGRRYSAQSHAYGNRWQKKQYYFKYHKDEMVWRSKRFVAAKEYYTRLCYWISFAKIRRDLLIVSGTGNAILTFPGSLHGLKQTGKDDLVVIIIYKKT